MAPRAVEPIGGVVQNLRRITAVSLFLASSAVLSVAAESAPHVIRVRLSNRSSRTVTGFYVSGVTNNKWDGNLLKNQQVKPGESMTFRFVGECGEYDVRVVTTGRTEYLEDEVPFCENDLVTIDERGLTKTTEAASSTTGTK